MNILAQILAVGIIFFGIYVGIYFLRKSPHRLYCHCFFVVSAAVYYAGGMLSTYWSLSNDQMGGLLREKYIEQSDVTYAMALVLVFLIILHVLCVSFPKITSLNRASIDVILRSLSQRRIFVINGMLILLLELYLMATGALGYMGVRTAANSNQISPLALTIQPFGFAIMWLSGFCLGTKRTTVWAAFIAFAQLALISVQGRRFFVIAVGFFILGLFLSGSNWKNLLRIAALSTIAFVPAFFFFLALRLTTYEVGEDASMSALIDRTWEAFGSSDSASRKELAANVKENVRERPFIIGYLAVLTAAPRKNHGAMGRAILLAASWAIPRMLYNEKDAIVDRGNELDVADEFLDVHRLQDEPKTIITTFYTDFREAGIFLGALFFISWLWLLKKFEAIAAIPYFQAIIIVIIIFNCLMVEKGFEQWFIDVRQAVLLTVCGFPIGLVLNNRARQAFQLKEKTSRIIVENAK
jgi:hypothetical protein